MARILLIDDDVSIRTMLRLMLAHHGHTVVEACDGREGMNLLRHAQADLVITDLVMPEKEGLEVVMELRKSQPLMKIIAISGGGRTNVAEDYLVMATRLGANKVLAKPFTHGALLATISELMPNDTVRAPAGGFLP